MLSVLVLGATGFIALPITKALRRNNYTVYALIRNAARSNEFLREEIIPIIGDISKPETWAEKAAQVDVVINASSAEFDAIVLNTVLKIAEQRPKEKAKLLYIFVGGTWLVTFYLLYEHILICYLLDYRVHGDNLTPVNDFTPPIPRELTSNRINVERQILSTATRALVDILILRPVLLYGGSASLFDLWFKPLAQAAKSQSPTLSLGANPLSLVGLVHKEDLAEAVKLFVEKVLIFSLAFSIPGLLKCTPGIGPFTSFSPVI